VAEQSQTIVLKCVSLSELLKRKYKEMLAKVEEASNEILASRHEQLLEVLKQAEDPENALLFICLKIVSMQCASIIAENEKLLKPEEVAMLNKAIKQAEDDYKKEQEAKQKKTPAAASKPKSSDDNGEAEDSDKENNDKEQDDPVDDNNKMEDVAGAPSTSASY